jgi:septal ring factor EnvC (AmiA/AmiB activator)
MKTVTEMARQAGIQNCTCDGTRGCLERFAELVRADAFEQNRQEGMKQERALWELTKLEQEIEAPPEQEPTLQEQLAKAKADLYKADDDFTKAFYDCKKAAANFDKTKANFDKAEDNCEKAHAEIKRIRKLIKEQE